MLKTFSRKGLNIVYAFQTNKTHKYCQFERFSSTNMSNSNPTFTEIRIPTELGFIAAKQWGNQHGRPVLALHGWQDNCGSFDPLIPWLDYKLNIVAIDFPGHGYSSHIPKGVHYNFMDMLYDVRQIVDYLKWTKFTVLGHSMGGGVGLMYASTYPDEVESVIALDIFKPWSLLPELIPARIVHSIKNRLQMREKLKVGEPVYTEESALDRLIKGQGGSCTENSARVLLKRGLKPSPDGRGVVYTRDLRLQIQNLAVIDSRMMKDYLSNFRSRLLYIKARDGLKYEKPEVLMAYQDMYNTNCKEYRFVEMEGTHHFHMNNPEVVGPVINNFLETSKL